MAGSVAGAGGGVASPVVADAPQAPGAEPSAGTAPRPRRAAGDTVAIPSQHVRAPVDVCQIVNGGLEPPGDVRRTCYWAGGSGLAARTGTTVITGHVNYVRQGTGALGNIAILHPGDTVLTADTARHVTSWRVRSVVHRPKTEGVDTAAFVGRDGPRTLYLITCGGAFDASEGSYVDNIYVLAMPTR